ncbi:SRPBCC family protein [Luteimonas terricola]|uniref:ATPase n=1 Tax=Luteimonas terricola TaxID=645597 RepID=A0ABQ2EMJ4_9GAMM|nr:SRPBCC family protein [Luteimonas terricola]GGK16661.1 ATPase [Luteimonas terricola]
MNDPTSAGGYGTLTDSATLRIERLLPGPVERVWAYLTDGALRRRWLAAGDMDAAGGTVELVWRNDELTDPPGDRPEGFGSEHRMQSRITVFEAPSRLEFTWGSHGSVLFELTPRGDEVLLVLTHSRIPDRAALLSVGPGWHAHLDVLSSVLGGTEPSPFWDAIARLTTDYAQRFPA